MIISVFKTSIKERDLITLGHKLNKLEGLQNWNTDLEDCDNILKVVSKNNITEEIIKILSTQGYLCEELED